MRRKFKALLSAEVGDMGLSSKAVDELVELGLAGLADGSTDEEISGRVHSVVPFAKAMQAEYTRKVQEAKQSMASIALQSQVGGQGDANGEGEDMNVVAGQDIRKLIESVAESVSKNFESRLASLEAENTALKQNEARKQREALIRDKAKELGIPDFLMKRMSISDDADYVKELTEYKQDLVTNKLMPADDAGEMGSRHQAMVDAAKAWAESLPNR